MNPTLAKIFLWLLVINLGIAFGAGLYESRIVLPQWLGASAGGSNQWDAALARRHNTGLNFWVYVTTVPLTLLDLANLFAAWTAALRCEAGGLPPLRSCLPIGFLHFSYFIPTMLTLMTDNSLSGAEATARLRGSAAWLNLVAALCVVALGPRD